MKNFFYAVFVFLLSCSLHSQNSKYVATNGDDNNSCGTIQSPCATVGYVLAQNSWIQAGDKIVLRGGTYRETFTVNNDGQANSRIEITAYDNESVTIDGTVDVTGNWSAYGNVSGAFQLNSYSEDITQLFVDDQPMVSARWPNAQFYDDSIFSHSTWAEGDEDNSSNGSLTIDESVHNPGSLDLNGSIGVLNIGSFKTWTVEMTGHTQSASNDVITYNTSDIGTYKDKHHYYFFEGKLNYLDTNNEWFHDKTNNILYVYPDDGLDPSSRSIKAKTTDYRVTLNGANYLTIKNINFFATTINVINSDNIKIENCNFYYPSASKRMLGTTSGMGSPSVMTFDANSDNNTVEKCLFEYSEGEAIRIKGDNNTIENNYFHHIDWSASELEGLMVSIYCTGDSNTFTKNTIHTTGASATVLPGTASTFSYNKVTNTGLLQSDGAVFQGTKANVANSKVHHNFVYDTDKYAFRYDAPGGDATQAGSFGIMHHNIADKTNGLMIKGNNQIIAHNTIINTVNNRNDIIILSEDCSNTNTWLYNNLAERIGSHRSATQFSLASNSPMPIAGNSGGSNYGYIKVSDDWRACQSGDTYYNATAGNGSSQNNIDQINVSRTGITYNSGVESLINYNSGDGKSESDYHPTSNTIINQGISPTNTVSTSSGTGQLNNLIPHTNVGAAADIGAFEVGESWTAGADWTPKFYNVYWKGATSGDWNTASNWSSGSIPGADNNVIVPGSRPNSLTVDESITVKSIDLVSGGNLIVGPDGKLTVSGEISTPSTQQVIVQQDSSGSGSLIAKSASSPNITFRNWLLANQWALIGIPVNGEVVNDVDNQLSTNGGKSAIGYWDNDKSDGAGWVTFNTGSTLTNELIPTRGYEIMRSSEGGVEFEGTMLNTDQNQAITTESGTNGNWNLVGNPYPSFLNLTDDSGDASNNFLTVNSAALGNGAYVAVYAWDGTSYDTYNQADGDSQDKMAPGDGFFVYASSDTNVSFTEAMQTHDNGSGFVGSVANGLLSNASRESFFKVSMSDGVEKKHLLISFTDKSTKGLDPGYDAGMLTLGNSHIYTRLIEGDEEIKLSIQSLPYNDLNGVVVAVGIDSKSSVLTLDVIKNTITKKTNIYLEDRLLNTFKELTSRYTIASDSELKGYGRFYLHFTSELIPELPTDGNLRVFKVSESSIRLMGKSDKFYNAKIYDFAGRLIKELSFNHKTDVDSLTKGVHILHIIENSSVTVKKFVVD